MRKCPMQEEVLNALVGSGLREANSAIELLRSGGALEVHDLGASCDELLRIYEIRLRHIRCIPAQHAHRLAEATAEFVSNLERHRSKVGRWGTIKASQELHFNIFLVDGEELLACLPVVSQLDVSPEKWAELWSSNA